MVVSAVVVAALFLAASPADACWGWGCYQPVSYYTPYYASWCSPCYTSCYTSYCGSWCGGWYGYAPVRRGLCGRYRWAYASGCCLDTCGWDCCCGTYVDSCCNGTTTTTTTQPTTEQQPTVAPRQPIQDPAPADPAPALETPPSTPPSLPALPTTSIPTRQNSGLLTVWVPAGAKVFVNGKETTTQGSRRRYVSYGLTPGLNYKYEVRAELVRNGRVAEETKTVYLTAGAKEGVAFGFNREPINELAAQR